MTSHILEYHIISLVCVECMDYFLHCIKNVIGCVYMNNCIIRFKTGNYLYFYEISQKVLWFVFPSSFSFGFYTDDKSLASYFCQSHI